MFVAGKAICDLMMLEGEPEPKPEEKILCRHPFEVDGQSVFNQFPQSVCRRRSGHLLFHLESMHFIRSTGVNTMYD